MQHSTNLLKIVLLQLTKALLGNCLSTLKIEQFASQSFVPEDIEISYVVEQQLIITYNLTIREQFPGKLLMNFFVRKYAVEPNEPSMDFMKFRNVDFCKTLESLRNISAEQMNGENIIPTTFLVSCPLIPGFYFMDCYKMDIRLLPRNVPSGKYMLHFELIQVYEEVTLLLNCKLKVTLERDEMEHTEDHSERDDAANSHDDDDENNNEYDDDEDDEKINDENDMEENHDVGDADDADEKDNVYVVPTNNTDNDQVQQSAEDAYDLS